MSLSASEMKIAFVGVPAVERMQPIEALGFLAGMALLISMVACGVTACMAGRLEQLEKRVRILRDRVRRRRR